MLSEKDSGVKSDDLANAAFVLIAIIGYAIVALAAIFGLGVAE